MLEATAGFCIKKSSQDYTISAIFSYRSPDLQDLVSCIRTFHKQTYIRHSQCSVQQGKMSLTPPPSPLTQSVSRTQPHFRLLIVCFFPYNVNQRNLQFALRTEIRKKAHAANAREGRRLLRPICRQLLKAYAYEAPKGKSVQLLI